MLSVTFSYRDSQIIAQLLEGVHVGTVFSINLIDGNSDLQEK